jgi:signal transduction histidine kinase
MLWDTSHADEFASIDLELPAAFSEQAALALQVTKAREDQALLAVFADRDRIARDLHDLVIQRLFAIGLGLKNTSRLSDGREVGARLSGAISEIDATIKEIRRSIFSLSAPESAPSLRRELAAVISAGEETLGFRPTLRTTGPVDTAVPANLYPHLVAVLTEAISNASRHAAAREVVVSLAVRAGEVVLVVSDDGQGFDPAHRERDSGIANMQYRAETFGGECEVRSIPGHGTVVEWRVPL